MSRINTTNESLAIIVGTGLRELRSLELWYTEGQQLDVSELHFGAAVQAATGAKCPVITLSNACAASISALGLAEDLVSSGEAQVAIVAGCDSITESMFGLVDRTNLNTPERIQPFDRNRRGIVMGEGTAAVIVETLSHAAARGAIPYGCLLGVGMSCDAHHETAPHRDGVLRAMADSHRRSNITPADVDLLLVHGTGTPLNDQTEALAIRDLFGESIGRVVVTAVKSLTGHTSGASGLIGVVTAIECLRRGRIPPTVGLAEPMEEVESFDIVTGSVREARLRIAQVNAFGFGGINAVAILEKYNA